MNTPIQDEKHGVESLVGQVADEFTECLNRGEHPDIEEYVRRYPEIATILRQALQALQAVGSLVPGSIPSGEAALEQLPPAGCLGDFRILREIGRGGMGVVYEAEQISLGRRVALKVLPFAATLDPKQLQRFKNEAQAAAHLHHTNIVPVFGVGCERGVHYYAMQFIEGQTLAAMIRELRQLTGLEAVDRTDAAGVVAKLASELVSGRWAPAQCGSTQEQPTGPYAPPPADHSAPSTQRSALAATPQPAAPSSERSTRSRAFFRTVANLGVQAAEALEHAHSLGVVHRDIKPANLLVDLRGILWITDFGLAHCQSQAGLTMTGDLLGTLRYMSPEQALAKRVLVDHRTDIYSLGASLYELLTLEPVFSGRDRQELLRQIAFEEPKPPRRLNKTIPTELETIILKAVEKNPAERYATAQELADDLERFLKDEPIRAKRPNLVQRARRWARRHKPVVGAAVVVLVVVGLVVAGEWLRFMQKRAATAEQVNLAFQEVSVLHDHQKWREALAAVKRAAALLANGSGDAELHHRAQELGKDLEMAVQLDDLRSQKHYYDNAGFMVGNVRAAIAYAKAFEAYGIDVLGDPPEQVAAAIQARSIREQLVAALDDWILVPDAGLRERLLAIAEVADPDDWRNRMRKAVVANDRRALEEVAARPEVASFPPATGYLLGQALANAGAGPRAVQVLAAVQQRHPQDFWLNYQLGIQLLWGPGVQHHHDDAAGFLRAALVARPDYAQVYTYLGIALPAPEHLDEVIALNRKAIELSPRYVSAHGNLGIALFEQRKYTEAEAKFREVLGLRPDDYQAHYQLGNALAKQERLAEAEAEFREALRLRPDYPEAHSNLGTVLADQGKRFRDPAQAVMLAKKAVERAPNDGSIWNTLGVAHYRAGNWKGAIEALKKAMELRKGGESFDWFFLAMAHWKLGEKDQARNSYDQAVQWLEKNKPQDQVLRRFRAEAADLLGIKDRSTPNEKEKPHAKAPSR